MNTYEFQLRLNQGCPCGGVLEMEADNPYLAQQVLEDRVSELLHDAFPELDIEFDLELVDEDDRNWDNYEDYEDYEESEDDYV